MIDFSTLQGLTIPEGVVTQVADAAGNVLWAVAANYPEGAAVLKVKKITSDTYAGETSYTNEKFVLLNIYPKTNGTVNVTYGGLTKTITDTSGAAEPNAQKVFFGTFNGVSDGVTLASGTMVIDGDYRGFGVCSYKKSSKDATDPYCPCITEVVNFGTSNYMPIYAFRDCTSLKSITIPSSIASISSGAFMNCSNLMSVSIQEGVTSTGSIVFSGCTNLESINIPASLTDIYEAIFRDCHKLTSFVVDSNNSKYFSEGEILFSKDKTVLHAYPSASGHYTIPSGVKELGENAFYKCVNLTGVTIPDGVVPSGSYVFEGCTGITSITIPASLCTGEANGGWYMFKGCTGLTDVTIQSGGIGILRGLFNNCTNLENVTIPDSITYISMYCFEGCTGLTNITIPQAVTRINQNTFNGCTGLTSVAFENATGWFVKTSSAASNSTGTEVDVTDTANNVTLITDTYAGYFWYRS